MSVLLQHQQSKGEDLEGGTGERRKRAEPARLCFLLVYHSCDFQNNNNNNKNSTLSYCSVSSTTNKSNLKAIRPRQIHPQIKTGDG